MSKPKVEVGSFPDGRPNQISGSSRVVRGASWYNDSREDLRSACRTYLTPASRGGNVGFRPTLTLGLSVGSEETPSDFENVTRYVIQEPLMGEKEQYSGTIDIDWGSFKEPWTWHLLQGKRWPRGDKPAGRLVLDNPANPAAGLVWLVTDEGPKIHHFWVEKDLRRRGVIRQLIEIYRQRVSPKVVMMGPFSPMGRIVAERLANEIEE